MKRTLLSGAVLCLAVLQASGAENAEIPGQGRFNDNTPQECGVIFRPLTDGVITQVRVYGLAEESGEHQMRIWRNVDNRVLLGPIAWNYGGVDGWTNLDIPDLAVEAGEEYTLSVSTSPTHYYPAVKGFFKRAITNQGVVYPEDAGVFTHDLATQPGTSFAQNSYLREVVFEAKPGAQSLGRLAREKTAPPQQLKVQVSWGHNSPAKRSFFVRLAGSELSLTNLQPMELETEDSLAGQVCRSQAGQGDVDGVALTLSYPQRTIGRIRKIVDHWSYLIAHSDPDTTERWRKDAGYRPDERKLTVELNEPGTRGFSLTVDQLLNRPAFWFPELDVFVAVGESPISFAEHQRELSAYKGQRILEQVHQGPEATYEEFTNRWEDMGSPRFHNPYQMGPGHIVCVTWDSALYKFGIDRGGNVVNDYGKADEFRFAYDFGRLDQELDSTWKSQRLSDGLPVITTTVEKEGTRYEVEQFAYPLHGPLAERRGDIPMVLMQKLKVTDLSGRARTLQVGMTHEHLLGKDGGGASERVQLRQSGERVLWEDMAQRQVLLAMEGTGFSVASNSVAGSGSMTNRIELAVELAANGSRELLIKLPSPVVSAQDRGIFEALDYAVSRERTERFWEDYLARGAEFIVPEKAVNDLFRANLWHSLRLPRRHGGEGPGVKIDLPYSNFAYSQTETPWPVNQGVLVDYMIYDLRGYHAIAREELAAIFHNNQEKDGWMGGAADWGVYSPGMLYSVSQNYLLSGDQPAFEALLPQTLKTLDYCLRQIRSSQQGTGCCPGLVLLPLNDASHASQPWGFNQAYYAAGVELMGKALAQLGHPRARECSEAASIMKETIERSFGRASALAPAVQLRDHTWIPYVPCDSQRPRRLLDAWYPTDVDTGPLHMSRLKALEPGGFLTTCLLLDHEDNLFFHGWGMANEPVYNQQATAYLSRDEVKPAIRAFYSGMACAFSHSVYEPVEHRWHHNQFFGPPSTDGTWFELYRNMMVQEGDDGSLLLLQATPRKWLSNGKRIEVKRAPTCFGPVSLSVESQTGRNEIQARLDVPQRKNPDVIVVRFRHPEAKPMRSVTVNSKESTSFDPQREWVRIAAPKEPRYDIVVHY